MNAGWNKVFQGRMLRFQAGRPPRPGEHSVSIKVRVSSGCFHREHSPFAYAAIDAHLRKLTRFRACFVFEEHESGPEILVYVAAVTAGLVLAKSVVELVTAIVKARSEGIRRGDHPSEPLELIVRRTDDTGKVREETVLRVGFVDPVDTESVGKHLKEGLRHILPEGKDYKKMKKNTRKKG